MNLHFECHDLPYAYDDVDVERMTLKIGLMFKGNLSKLNAILNRMQIDVKIDNKEGEEIDIDFLHAYRTKYGSRNE